jgi:hypothetical protein
MSPEEQNESFICKIPDTCEFLDEGKFQAKAKGNTYNMMNYWVRKAIKYLTEEDTFLSQDGEGGVTASPNSVYGSGRV